MNTCNTCKKEYSNKYNLLRHQEKSCKIKEVNKCEKCQKVLSTKQRLLSHLNVCKEEPSNTMKQESTIKRMSKKIEEISDELEKLKNKPATMNNITITTNNTDNSSVNNYCSLVNYMTPEVVRESFKNFTITNLLAGSQKELAEMTIKKFFTGKKQPLYICTDRSRNKFFYTNEENKEMEDANAIVLRTLIHNGIAPLLKKLYHEEYIKLYDELARCKRTDDNALIIASRADIKELDEAYKQFNLITQADDYISHLAKCLPSSIKDRIYQDALIEKMVEEKDSSSDIEFHKQLEMIGDYTASELRGCKETYKNTGVIQGPRDIMEDKELKQRYIAFLKE